MTTASERFELAIKAVESVQALTQDLHTIGVYDKEEFDAAGVIVKSLNRALYILDPERADEYVKGVLEGYMKEHGGQLPATSGLGQYL